MESRAAALNLSVNQLCQRAGVPANNWSRWKSRKVAPTLRVFARDLEKMQACLDDEEDRLFLYLKDRLAVRPKQNGAQADLEDAIVAGASA